jgi:hypothetical protein
VRIYSNRGKKSFEKRLFTYLIYRKIIQEHER